MQRVPGILWDPVREPLSVKAGAPFNLTVTLVETVDGVTRPIDLTGRDVRVSIARLNPAVPIGDDGLTPENFIAELVGEEVDVVNALGGQVNFEGTVDQAALLVGRIHAVQFDVLEGGEVILNVPSEADTYMRLVKGVDLSSLTVSP